MADLPEAGAKLTLDLSEWESNWASATDQASELQSQIDDMGGTVDVDFSVDDSALPFDEIPESTETEVNVTEDEKTKGLLDGLNFLVAKEKIEWAIEIAGNVWDFFSKVEGLTLAPFLDVEDAVAKINAQTGGTGIADLGQLIRDLQFADLGDSVQQIGDTVIAAKQLNLPIKDAATAALTFTHTFKDENPTTVLETLSTLVKTGLVPNLQTAADLMTVAFQQGVNKGGDALAVVNANAQSWADMGLNGTQALSAINSLQDAGVDSATDAAKMIQTLDDALTTAADNASSPQAEALKTLGMTNPKDSGQAMGADFIDGFAASFANLPTDKQDLISGVLFGKGGKKFTGALEGLTTQGGPFENVVNAASDAATEIDNSLRGAIDDFVLEINKSISDLLSSENIDLPGKIDALKKGFQKAVDVLQSGGTIGEAIEVGLNIPGFNDAVTRFEASIGNFAISVLEIVAGIQEFLGKDSSGTRAQIATMEKNQLPFNLKVANPDEIAGELQTAIDRGLTTSDIAKATGTAFNELISGGDIEKAQALVDSLNTLSESGGPMLAPGLNGEQISIAQAALRDGSLERIQEQIDAGNLIAPVSVDTTAMQDSIDAAVEAAKPKPQEGWWNNLKPPDDFLEKALHRNIGDTSARDNEWWTSFAGQGGFSKNTADEWLKWMPPPEVKTSVTDLDTTTATAGTNIQTTMDTTSQAVTVSNDEMVASMQGTALQAQIMDTDIANAMMGNTVTASFDAVAMKAAEAFPAVMDWFTRTIAGAGQLDNGVSIHLRSIIKQLNDLNFLAMTTIGNLTQVTALGGAGGGGGTTNNITNNVNVNNNVQGNAQATANGYAIGASLRPGG